MTKRFPRMQLWKNVAALVCAIVALVGCRTLEYRQVQTQFHEAVQADNTGMSLGRQHEAVVERLTPEYIGKLDPKLRPNAWMLRAVSAWRAGLTNDVAEKSAEKGLGDTNLVSGSRDHVVLKMIPALVVDSDLLRRWMAASRQVTPTHYQETYERGFRAALQQLNTVPTAMNEGTSPDARAYFHYHRWRVLQNWASVAANLRPMEEMIAANDRASAFVGNTNGLVGAANQDRDQIPNGHPLRALVRARGGN